MPPPELSPEQWAFVEEFSANYVAGRKFLCWAARAVVAIGLLAAGVTAIVAAFQLILGLQGGIR